VKAGQQEQVKERAGVDQRKREGRDPAGERKRKEKQINSSDRLSPKKQHPSC